MAEIKEVIRLIDNLYSSERLIAAMEKEPRYYDTEYLLYTNEVHTLKMIAENEGITQKELTEKMFRTKGATSLMIKKLENKNLIMRKADEKDGRWARLWLTEQGLKVHQSHLLYDESKMNEWKEQLNLETEEIVIANHVLETMLKVLHDNVLLKDREGK